MSKSLNGFNDNAYRNIRARTQKGHDSDNYNSETYNTICQELDVGHNRA